MISADALIAAARSLVGVRYVHQGHGPHGVDCIGFVTYAAELAGLDVVASLPRRAGERAPNFFKYARTPQPLALEYLTRWAKPTPAPVAGGLVFFTFPRETHPSHLAIFTRDATIVHSLARAGRVAETRYGAPWTRLTHSCWRLPGVVYV